MNLMQDQDCVGRLLDVLCYEMVSGRLSCEMEQMLRDHLITCASCRESAQGYLQMLADEEEPAPSLVS